MGQANYTLRRLFRARSGFFIGCHGTTTIVGGEECGASHWLAGGSSVDSFSMPRLPRLPKE